MPTLLGLPTKFGAHQSKSIDKADITIARPTTLRCLLTRDLFDLLLVQLSGLVRSEVIRSGGPRHSQP